MHLLYAKRLDGALKPEQLKKRYAQRVEQSYDLYLFNLWQLVKITELSREDAAKRASKYLPSEEDKRFSPKLYENPIVQSLVADKDFAKLLKGKKIPARMDKDMGKLFYTEFAKQEDYGKYIKYADGDPAYDRDILLALYRFCAGNETFCEYVEDRFDNWVHDKSLVVGAMKKTIKALPASPFFYKDYLPDDETVKEFGEELLHKALFFDEELLEIIEPALKNWEVARVAVIDLILLKMALCEMLHFPTIPVKVTINEFVDISKVYSTPKSKDFINGILDRLMKKLLEEGKIIKEGRGLID